mmetsp:Transcript_11713/g.29599  ORF Transcript_11713/g.29599 Transcript_11713/m.29599 type:complete len:405 (-) Transcript_11713:47-1261(-)
MSSDEASSASVGELKAKVVFNPATMTPGQFGAPPTRPKTSPRGVDSSGTGSESLPPRPSAPPPSAMVKRVSETSDAPTHDSTDAHDSAELLTREEKMARLGRSAPRPPSESEPIVSSTLGLLSAEEKSERLGRPAPAPPADRDEEMSSRRSSSSNKELLSAKEKMARLGRSAPQPPSNPDGAHSASRRARRSAQVDFSQVAQLDENASAEDWRLLAEKLQSDYAQAKMILEEERLSVRALEMKVVQLQNRLEMQIDATATSGDATTEGDGQDKELVKARSQLVQLKRIMDRKVQELESNLEEEVLSGMKVSAERNKFRDDLQAVEKQLAEAQAEIDSLRQAARSSHTLSPGSSRSTHSGASSYPTSSSGSMASPLLVESVPHQNRVGGKKKSDARDCYGVCVIC